MNNTIAMLITAALHHVLKTELKGCGKYDIYWKVIDFNASFQKGDFPKFGHKYS